MSVIVSVVVARKHTGKRRSVSRKMPSPKVNKQEVTDSVNEGDERPSNKVDLPDKEPDDTKNESVDNNIEKMETDDSVGSSSSNSSSSSIQQDKNVKGDEKDNTRSTDEGLKDLGRENNSSVSALEEVEKKR